MSRPVAIDGQLILSSVTTCVLFYFIFWLPLLSLISNQATNSKTCDVGSYVLRLTSLFLRVQQTRHLDYVTKTKIKERPCPDSLI